MGIFTRFADIVSSNINSILDKAEDPEKMVRLMILEMEDTLVELRHQCAGVIADQKKIERRLAEARSHAAEWEEKARLALRKEREELARQALLERKTWSERVEALEAERLRLEESVATFRGDLAQLEAKLEDARARQRSILARRTVAQGRLEAQTRIRKADAAEAMMKFEAYEQRIDRLEADAEMASRPRSKGSLRDEFAALESEDEIDRELARLREEMARG